MSSKMESKCRTVIGSLKQHEGKIKYVEAFGEEDRYGVMFVTTDDEVFGVGYNGDFNLLGVTGEYFLRKWFETPVKIEQLCGKGIKKISIGDHQGIALSSHDVLFQWGLPFSKVRSCYDKCSIRLPHVMTSCTHVVTSLDCGGGFFAVLTKRRKVFVWGYIDWSAPFCDGRLFSPMHKDVVSMSCGAWHIVILTADGRPYACGHGGYGQLGYDWSEGNGYWRLQKLTFDEPCVQVMAGSVSTLILTDTGELWACGLNHHQFGYLGVDSEESTVKTPIKVQINEAISEVVSSFPLSSLRNVYAAKAKNSSKLYLWGWGCEYKWPQPYERASNLYDVFESHPTPSYLGGRWYSNTNSEDDDKSEHSSLSDAENNLRLLYDIEEENDSQPAQASNYSYNEVSEPNYRIKNLFSKNSNPIRSDLALNNLNTDRDVEKNHKQMFAENPGAACMVRKTSDPDIQTSDEVVCDSSTYKSYLDYVYSGGTKHLKFTELLDIHLLAVHYRETQLIEHTQSQITNRLNATTFPFILKQSLSDNSGRLRKLYEMFVVNLCKHPQDVLDLIISMHLPKT